MTETHQSPGQGDIKHFFLKPIGGFNILGSPETDFPASLALSRLQIVHSENRSTVNVQHTFKFGATVKSVAKAS